MTLELIVPGLPTPQGSKTAVPGKLRPRVIDAGSSKSRAAHRAWRKAVNDGAAGFVADARLTTLDEPCEVWLEFSLPPIDGDPARTRHRTKPDLDKLIRSVLDSLVTGQLLRDDSRVFEVHASKKHDATWTGVRIWIEPRGVEEQRQRGHRLALVKAQKNRVL